MKPILIVLAALSANNALAGVTPVMATQTPTTFSYATDSLYLPQNAGVRRQQTTIKFRQNTALSDMKNPIPVMTPTDQKTEVVSSMARAYWTAPFDDNSLHRERPN